MVRRWLWVLLVMLVLGLSAGCGQSDALRSVHTFTLHSDQLQKDMFVSVLLPRNYSSARRYPVLYFFGDYGGGAALVTRDLATNASYLRLEASGQLAPLIIVGVAHDQSFMLETDAPTERVTTTSGRTFGVGRYESYFVAEVIPFVERTYSTITDASGRYIGGYSLGGYAALRLGLSRPDLFSRVGAHSPTLFFESLPDVSVTGFLYPDEKLRDQRDPLRLIGAMPAPPPAAFYIDTALDDINRDACESMADRLRTRGVRCELHLYAGTHSRSYWLDHMVDYLAFYTGPLQGR